MSRAFLPALLLLGASSPALAQGPFTLDIDQPQSNFTWSGQTSLGPIVGNPSNAFQLAGVQLADVQPSGGVAYGAVAFAGGDAQAIPDLHGKIPNAFSFLPPLATIDVLGLRLSLGSAPFAPDAATGAFTADVTLTALAGTLVVTPLASSPQVTDLTGLVSSPSPASGAIGASGPSGAIALSIPVDSTFPFNDPASGVSGTITVVGTMHAAWLPPAPAVYCTPKVNSLGCAAVLGSSGFPRYTPAQAFTLEASNVMSNQPGLLFYGTGADSSPFQGGFLCVETPVVRTPVQASGGNPPPNDCSGAYSIDFNAWIQGGADASLVPGLEVFAQYWSRDPGAASSTGLSAAIRFTIAP